MPYPSGHRSAVKKNIIDSARMLFNRHGFDNVSIHQIMAGAGLTHGGFYSYFKTKSSVCRGIGVLLHRPGMEELLGRRGSGPVVRRRGAAGRPRLSITSAFRGRREFLPDGRLAD